MKNNSLVGSLLKEPGYGFHNEDGTAKMPKFWQVIGHLGHTANPFGNQRKQSVFCMLVFYALSLAGFVFFVANYVATASVLYAVFVAQWVGHIHNSIWLHRYCSHNAFKFSKLKYSTFFLYTDPIFFGDDSYAIPHLVHHTKTDKPGDPYGPHIGWLASLLGPYINTAIRMDISEKTYNLLTNRFAHLNLKVNSYDTFRASGLIEGLPRFLTRKLVAQAVWISVSWLIGGLPFVFAYLAGVFVSLTLLLDFNWRGHGGNFRTEKKPGWEFDQRTRALNQTIYGILGSEWHDNHHSYPGSANTGFLPVQFDLTFHVIRAMKCLGIVSQYNDSSEEFRNSRKRADEETAPMTRVAE